MRLHFVLLPDASTRKITAKYARHYTKKYPHEFEVDNRKLIPHITLLGANVTAAQYKKLEIELIAWLKAQHPIRLKVDGLLVWFPQAWVGFNIKSNPQLTKMRKQLFSLVQKYCDGLVLKTSYNPHITITRLKRKEDESLPVTFDSIPDMHFSAGTFAICLSGEHSQIYKYKIIKEYKLR